MARRTAQRQASAATTVVASPNKPAILKGRRPAMRRVLCTHCEHGMDVAKRAMSMFCPQCRKRLILEDFKIRTYYAVRDFSTCGDIVVERKGHVVAPIKVGNLTVKGKVQGNVTARGRVTIAKTGSLKGGVDAPAILIETGASLDGFVRIGPVERGQK